MSSPCPQQTWLGPESRLCVRLDEDLAICHTHAELEAHLKRMHEHKWGMWCGHRIVQLFKNKLSVFVDITSWASAAGTQHGQLGPLAAAQSLADVVCPKLELDREGARAFPTMLLAYLLRNMAVVEVYAPKFRPYWPVPVVVRPYFDIDIKLGGPDTAEVPWDTLIWGPGPPMHGVEYTLAAPLPPAHLRVVTRVMRTADAILTRAFEEISLRKPEPPAVFDERWRVTVAFRGSKCSMHAVWASHGLECTLRLRDAIEQAAGEGMFFARMFDEAVYRARPDTGFQYRSALCPANKAQPLGGMHLPLLPDGRVWTFDRDRVSPDVIRKTTVKTAMDMWVQVDRASVPVLASSAWPDSACENPRQSHAAKAPRRASSTLAQSQHVRRQSSGAFSTVYGHRCVGRQIGAVCAHVDPSWKITRVSRTQDGGSWIVCVSSNNQPRTCHMNVQHKGRQDYMLFVSGAGRLAHRCFKGGAASPCREQTMACSDLGRDVDACVRLYRSLIE